MLCSERTAIGTLGANGVAVTLRCKCWSCPICYEINRYILTRLICQLQPTHFLTLTVNPAFLDDPSSRAANVSKAWSRTRKALKMKFSSRFDFVAIFERTLAGEPHLHIALADCPVSTDDLERFLSHRMDKYAQAPNVDVTAVYNDSGLSWYLAKEPHQFDGCKRYWTSRGWRSTSDLNDAMIISQIVNDDVNAIAKWAEKNGQAILALSQRKLITETPLNFP